MFAGLPSPYGGRRHRKMPKDVKDMLMKKGKGGKKRGGFLPALAATALGSLAGPVFEQVMSAIRGNKGSGAKRIAGKRAGKLKKGSPEAKAFMAKIRAKSGRGRRGIGGAILTPGPLL